MQLSLVVTFDTRNLVTSELKLGTTTRTTQVHGQSESEIDFQWAILLQFSWQSSCLSDVTVAAHEPLTSARTTSVYCPEVAVAP